MISKILKKTFVLSILSLSLGQNIVFYFKNNNLKKDKTEMVKLCKYSINNNIKYINEIKQK